MRRTVKEGLIVLQQVGIHVQSDHLPISRQHLSHRHCTVACVHAHIQHATSTLSADQRFEELTCM